MHLSIKTCRVKPALVCLFIAFTLGVSAQINESDWKEVPAAGTSQDIAHLEARLYSIDVESIFSQLSPDKEIEMWLPDPEGAMSLYRVRQSQTIDSSVAAYYEISTYRGYQVDNPYVLISCSITPQWINVAVHSGAKSYVIEPSKEDSSHLVYYTNNMLPSQNISSTDSDQDVASATAGQVSKSLIPDVKKTYRLALVASGEYSQQFGGNPINITTVLNSLAAGVNRLNLIYLRDLGIEFNLVSTPGLVFTNPTTDPFTTSLPQGLALENEAFLENSITPLSYDVGHAMFWANLGGDSRIDVVCLDGFKGAGYSSSIVSDTELWIDQAAHHLGHQFGATNTHSARECTNAVQGNTYEPGEGSSIMANAGKCAAAARYTPTADPFFHYVSVEQIYQARLLDATTGTGCAVTDPTGNPADPQVNAGDDIDIPISTPFILVGAARDNDPNLTYDWEQFDGNGLGTMGSPLCMQEVPLFRYRPPMVDSFRFFPEYAEVLLGNNNGVTWEVLPCTPRRMNFSCAVRDNNPNWGRVSHDTMKVNVMPTGPFAVTFPNGNEMLNGGQAHTITWDENGTSGHCLLVDIHISTDGGLTFSLLANAVSNAGMASVVLPNMTTGTARILITCDVPGDFGSASTFYDISDNDFEINQTMTIDNDGDGFDVTVDCDDNNANVYPGATEICNGIDDNCSTLIDDNDPLVTGLITFYEDADGDGFGNEDVFIDACTAPVGFVTDFTDCNDTDSMVNSTSQEICNGIDDDCDGLVDGADPSLMGSASTWYADADGDSFGDPSVSQTACTQPTGFVDNDLDCDDTNANVNPGAAEICNGIDDNCNNLVDDNDPGLTGGSSIWYEDNDGDNFGSPQVIINSCTQPVGFVSDGTDCDDTNPNVNPNAQEICNGIDDDCDGLIDGMDPNVTGGTTWYADNDGDGFGNPFIPTNSCSQPSGFVSNDLDCDDSISSIFPGAPEICNGVDDDCDGFIDTADPNLIGALTWYGDFDGDGFGNIGNAIIACTPPNGFVANNLDCNDNNADINPAAIETCNGIDDDCDNLVDGNDPSLVGASIWYQDSDFDGFGDPAVSIISCTPQIGFVSNNGDCDDTNINVNPGATEICNGIDDDCDSLVDDNDPSVSGLSIWYLDADMDGFGNLAVSLSACNQPSGYVANSTDCNDNDATVSAASPEICNGIDDDCDGLIDQADPDVQGGSIWFQDFDADGFGSPASTLNACSQPTGFVPNDLDCDDTNPAINPAAQEICNGIDDDCDGLTDDADPNVTGASVWFADFDGDGFGSSSATLISCTQPIDYVPNDLDCNDNNINVNPAAGEICNNNIDDDCDGLIDGADPDVSGGVTTWFADLDGDGFGDANSSLTDCNQPSGFVGNDLDCDDTNPNINPAIAEICDNNIDDDCDGLIDTADPDVTSGAMTWFQDVDNDGFGNPNSSLTGCNQPAGFVANNLDCNDNNAEINPSKSEICDNGIDDDCDGLIDTADPDLANSVLTWYFDMDGDMFGGDVALLACTQPAGFVLNSGDCDDSNNSIFPGAQEICDNGIDDDCDGLIDDTDPDVVMTIWYRDQDQDGFGNLAMALTACTQPDGFVSNGIDCNDQDASINPNALELCDNGIDDDCDGLIDSADPDETGTVFWYQDADGDGFGNPQEFSLSCTAPTGFVMDNTDCNDNAANINPGALELCDNGIDDDCDGLIDSADPDVAQVGTWYLDSDGDGFGDANNSIQTCNPGNTYVNNNTDCDDTNAAVNPEGIEVCNSRDDDCNGLVDIEDPNLSGVGIWFADEDEDGFGDPDNFIFECSQQPGFIPNNQDCDDSNPDVNPDAVEFCNGIDDNCDGLLDDMDMSVILIEWYLDVDGDGFGDPNNSIIECNQPLGFVDNDLDCDDLDPDINPAQQEIEGNEVDENCDGLLTTSTISIAESNYSIYPNPVMEVLNIDGLRGEQIKVSLIDIQGRVILDDTYTLPARISVDGLIGGTYLILLKDFDTGQQALDKLVKLN